MKKGAQIAFVCTRGASQSPSLVELTRAGYRCVVHEVDDKIQENTGARWAGSPTADAIVLSLGPMANETASLIIRTDSRLKNRVFIIDAKDPPDGSIPVTDQTLIAALSAAE